jgi:hypothetical protein
LTFTSRIFLRRRLLLQALLEVLDRLAESLSEIGDATTSEQEHCHSGDNQQFRRSNRSHD